MKTNKRTLKMVQLAALTAILIIMAFTPLGYLRTAGLEITFNMIPVAIGAVVLGPMAGAWLGAVFGATAFLTCVTGSSPFGAMLLSINPLGTVVTAFLTRVAEGWLTGLISAAIRKTGKERIGVAVANLACPVLNTVLFMGCLVLFFYQTEYIQGFVQALGAANPFVFIALFVGIQGVVEAIVTFLIGTAVSYPLLKLNRNRE